MCLENKRKTEPERAGGIEAFAEKTGRFGVYLFSFFALQGTGGANVGLALMLLALLAHPRPFLSFLRRDPLAIVGLLFAVYIVVHAAWSAHGLPATGREQWSDGWNWINLALFVLIAWWLAGDNRRILIAITLFLAGFIFELVQNMEWSRMAQILGGARFGFSFPLTVAGLLSVAAVLGLTLLARRLWGGRGDKRLFALRFFLWAVSLIIALQALIISQSRAAWLAAAVALLMVTALHVFGRRKEGRPLNYRLAFAILVLLGGVTALNVDTIGQRMRQESNLIGRYVSLELDKIPFSSVGARIHLAAFGLAKWWERPLLGWGPGTSATQVLTQDAHSPEYPLTERQRMKGFAHLHNAYIETLVRVGAVGGGLLCAIAVVPFFDILRARREGRMPRDFFLWLVAVMVVVWIWNLTDFRVIKPDTGFLLIFLAGIAHSYRVRERRGETPCVDSTGGVTAEPPVSG